MLPTELGYSMAAEWAPHAATWIAWPHNRLTWPHDFERVAAFFARLVETLAAVEPVQLLAGGEVAWDDAQRHVGDVPNVTLWDVPTDDAWIRDHGPTFLAGPVQAEPVLVDWGYNAWGAKYAPFDHDNAVPAAIAKRLARRRFAPGMVLEGGAIDTDGRGTLLASRNSILNDNRNPGMSQRDVERRLADFLGIERVVWLDGCLEGDDTDGHVDQSARFVAPGVVVAAREGDRSDPNHAALESNWQRLGSATDATGRALEVIPLPMPRPIHHQGVRLPASHANFYLANGLVVVPVFDDPSDAEAIALFERLFPERRVVGLPSLDLIGGLGGIHCVTRQEPVV